MHSSYPPKHKNAPQFQQIRAAKCYSLFWHFIGSYKGRNPERDQAVWSLYLLISCVDQFERVHHLHTDLDILQFDPLANVLLYMTQ